MEQMLIVILAPLINLFNKQQDYLQKAILIFLDPTESDCEYSL